MSNEVLLDPASEQLKKLTCEAYYSGERIILRGEEGSVAVIVPLEDLALLEEMEGEKHGKIGRLVSS